MKTIFMRLNKETTVDKINAYHPYKGSIKRSIRAFKTEFRLHRWNNKTELQSNSISFLLPLRAKRFFLLLHHMTSTIGTTKIIDSTAVANPGSNLPTVCDSNTKTGFAIFGSPMKISVLRWYIILAME